MIIVRRAKVGDEKGMIENANAGIRSGTWKYTGTNKPYGKERLIKTRKQLISKNPDTYIFVAVDKTSNKIIGVSHAAFRKKGRLRHRIDLGWSIHPDYGGRGIGTKLVKYALNYAKKKGFKRAEAEIAVVNTASVNLAKDVGFKIEGIKKKGLLLDSGKYIDTYIVGKIL